MLALRKSVHHDSTQPDLVFFALEEFAELLKDGLIFLDPDWRIIYANAAARSISRIKPEDLNGPSHWDLYPATLGTPQEQIYRRSMSERISLEHEFYYPPFDIWIELRTYPVPQGIAVHYRDITRLRRAEKERDETTRQLAQLLNATTDAFVYLDRSFNYTYLNREARQRLAMYGNLIGRNLWEEFPHAADPNSIFYKNFHHTMDTGEPCSFEACYPGQIETWFSFYLAPTEDGLVFSFRDITEERRAAAELLAKKAESERRLAVIEAIYETSPIGLAYFDPVEFRYLRLNQRQAEFFAMTPEQILGKRVTDLAPIPGVQEMFEQVAAGVPVINAPLEGELVGRPGEYRYWTVNYFPVYGPDGKIQGITAASLEITHQKRSERALLESEKLAAVGRLAASISHEINNPLEAVTNLIYLIGQSSNLPNNVREWVDLAQTELTRVSHITTETLRFHRQATAPTLVTARQLVGLVLNLYQGRLSNSGIQVETRYLSESRIRCFENNIRQVLNNLISNAVDAMRAGGGRLLVRAHDATDWQTGRRGVRITVADNGMGIPQTARSHVFEAFFTTKELNGTGLGLWISADIVRQHEGRLTFRSSQNPAHHGTVFTLFLPVS